MKDAKPVNIPSSKLK